MASYIKIKRSTGTLAPATLQYGELAYTTGVGTHGNSGGRLFIGDNVPNSISVGGRYYTDLLSISPGLVANQQNPTTPANGFVAILDENRKVDQWNVDNLTLDGNTLSSSDVDGDINLDPNGIGEIVVPDDTYLTFGTSKDTKIKYDEITNDKLEISGADWNFIDGVAISINDTTQSNLSTTGALTVSGGVGIGSNLNVGENVNIDGGNLTTNELTFNVFNTNATSVNAFGAAANINLGANSGILTVGNPTVVGTQATQNLYNTVATTVNAFGDATNITIGANSGILTVSNPTVVGTELVQNLYNTVATSVNAFGDAVNINLGANSGILTVGNPTVVGTQATQNLYNTVATTVNAFGDATFVGIGSTSDTSTVTIRSTKNSSSNSTGALVVSGGVGIASDVYIGGAVTIGGSVQLQSDQRVINLTVQNNTNLGSGSTDQVTIVGNLHQTGISTIVGELYVDSVGITSNTIFTKFGSGDTLFIDPYPSGLSNEGTVVIKGDLQVDGTQTFVNSVSVTSNNPIYIVGDNATTRTVASTVASIGSTITIDSVAGISTNDVVTGTNIPTNTVISDIDSILKVITLSNPVTGSIDSGTQLTISQGVDTNDDRGVGFKYISSGIGTEAIVKTGFFGYDDSTSRWTYVPDASITGNVVSGTKGNLDIKGIYYQSGDFNTNGVTYFGNDGLMKSTVSPGSGISTSNYVLTTDDSGVPTWTDTIDGGTF